MSAQQQQLLKCILIAHNEELLPAGRCQPRQIEAKADSQVQVSVSVAESLIFVCPDIRRQRIDTPQTATTTTTTAITASASPRA